MKCLQLLLVSICIICIVQCTYPVLNKDRIGEPVLSVNLRLLDSTTLLNTANLKDSTFLVMFFFEPYCQFCREETQSILSNMEKFRHTQFCFLSISALNDVRSFSNSFNMNKYSNIRIGVDTGFGYMKHFDIKGVPHVSIYSPNGLKALFPYKVDAKELLDVIN